MRKKIIGVIPARKASTRFPGKALALIQGKPMIQWVIEGVQKSQCLNGIFVATDDPEIFKVSEKSGVQALMTPSDLTSGTDRIYQATKDIPYDVAINIQGDEPLIEGRHIDFLCQIYLQGENPDMATLAHPISEDDLKSTNAVKVVLNKKSEALYFSRFPIPHSRHDAKFFSSGPVSLKHMGIYAYRKDFLKSFCETEPALLEKAEGLEQLRALHMGARIRVVEVEGSSWGVDTPEDLQALEKYLSQKK